MMMTTMKVAIVEVGDLQSARDLKESYEKLGAAVDIYIYERTISEIELKKEINQLLGFYDKVEIALPLPPHIRERELIQEEI